MNFKRFLVFDCGGSNGQRFKTGIQVASKKYKDIESIGVDAWGADFAVVDKNGTLISNPVHYRDLSRFSIVNELYSIISKRELFELTGGLVLPGVSSGYLILSVIC